MAFVDDLRAHEAQRETLHREDVAREAQEDLVRIKKACLRWAMRPLAQSNEVCRVLKSSVTMNADLEALLAAEKLVVSTFEGDEEEWWRFTW